MSIIKIVDCNSSALFLSSNTCNRPFWTGPNPLICFKARLSAKPLIWKRLFILTQIKPICTARVSHLVPFLKWEFVELGNGLFTMPRNLHCKCAFTRYVRYVTHLSRIYTNGFVRTPTPILPLVKEYNFSKKPLASYASVFRGASFSSLPTNACSTEDSIPFPCLANHIVLSKFWKVDLDRKVIW